MRALRRHKKYDEGGVTPSLRDAMLMRLKDPDTLEALLSELDQYDKPLKGYAAADKKREEELYSYLSRAKDFMKRYYQSDSYKKTVGGREMMQSDQGFEDSALGERLENTDAKYMYTIPNKDRSKGVSMTRALKDYLPADLREPSRYVVVSERGMSEEPYPMVVHELSHSQGDPARTSFMTENLSGEEVDYPNSNMALDRSMMIGNPSRQKKVIYTDFDGRKDLEVDSRVNHPNYNDYEGIAPSVDIKDDPSRGNIRPEIVDSFNIGGNRMIEVPSYQVSNRNREYDLLSDNRLRAQNDTYIRYLNSPTEMAARMRAVTAKAQETGDLEKNNFDLNYDIVVRLANQGFGQAQQILAAMGVMDLLPERQGEVPKYYEQDEEKAREAFNKYLRYRV